MEFGDKNHTRLISELNKKKVEKMEKEKKNQSMMFGERKEDGNGEVKG